MKFLTIGFCIIEALCLYFLFTDGPDSGMVWPSVGVPLVYGLVLSINKARTGVWFTDSSGGH